MRLIPWPWTGANSSLQASELATRIRQAEKEVKKLVEDYPTEEGDEDDHHDLERGRHDLDEGSDDDDDGRSDTESLDALDERWNELEVSY